MGKSYSSDEIIRKLKADGWKLDEVEGDHYQFKHPTKKGKVTVQHPKKDMSKYNVASISRQSGLKF
jgi:predicted RNA binding protein YcfA (HicA-like mRNA interferase family)